MASRLNPCAFLPRRLQVVATLTAFVIFCIFFLGTSNTDDYDPYLQSVPFIGPQLQSTTHHVVEGAHQIVDNIPKLPDDIPYGSKLNPFKAPTHKPPPEQSNSTSGEARWYSDWKWRNPFSSSVTLDEDRAVLPPQIGRPVIYTYFDSEGRRKDEKSKKAEQQLIQIWRRAWWAKGFKPVLLGPGEARNHPLYPVVRGLTLTAEMRTQLMNWLAWSRMDGGILCNWLAVPMAAYDDPLFTFLRHREYPVLTRYEDLGNALFVGSKADVEKAIRVALDSLEAAKAKNETQKQFSSVQEAIPKDTVKFVSESNSKAIAYYGSKNIEAKYKPIHDKLSHNDTRSEGLALLPPLINSHLHTIWQNTFSSGVAVLKPLPEHMTAVVEYANSIARDLAECSNSSMPTSCPPNRPHCKPCSSHQMSVTNPIAFRNTSTIFTIGAVPHPYTLNSLVYSREGLSVEFIRRSTKRDSWISAVTKEILSADVPAYACLIGIKDAVASAYGASRSLWVTAERLPTSDYVKDMEELDWLFGFQAPRYARTKSEAATTKPPSSSQAKAAEKLEHDVSNNRFSAEQLVQEKGLFEKARDLLKRSEKMGNSVAKQTRGYVEAWNLADTEAWKFVRAYNARRRVERQAWWMEEEAFQGKGTLDRWKDKLT